MIRISGERLKALVRRLRCWTGEHEWTGKHEQGIAPSYAERSTGLFGFSMYSAGYCKYCKKVMPPSVTRIVQAWEAGEVGLSGARDDG